MNVAALQQLLDDIGRLLATAGVRHSTVDELADFREGLTPFRELPLKKLISLLVQGDAAERGAPSPRGGRQSRGRSQDRPDAGALGREIQSLYERAADPAVSEADIDALAARLTPLTKDGLIAVATAIELKVAKSKSKDQIIREIRQRILARKGAHQRAYLLGHPSEVQAEPVPAVEGDGTQSGGGVQPTPHVFPG